MLEELRKACADGAQSESKALANGPLVAHIGYPAPAQAGTIALKLADVVTVISEADILRVEKRKSLYRVWTSGDANIIVRLETVAKAAGDARAGACDCHGDGESSGGIIARDNVHVGNIEIPVANCRTVRICTTVFGRPYCFNRVVCDGEGNTSVSWDE